MAGYRIIKTCGCGKTYNRKSWAALRLVGHQHLPKDAYGREENIELRDCSCGSTLAIEVTRAVTKGKTVRY